MATLDNLPVLSDSQRNRSNAVKKLVVSSIQNSKNGVIGFDEFMEIVLYTENLGYYDAGDKIFGKDGDFLTAPSSGQLFGECVANELGPVLDSLDCNILEFGAGGGDLAKSVCSALGEFHDFHSYSYHIIEPNESLWVNQKTATKDLSGGFFWHKSLPRDLSKGVLIANEVLDAMPATRYLVDNGTVQELGVALSGQELVWKEKSTDVPEQIKRVLKGYEDGYRTEMIHGLEPWLNSIFSSVEELVFFIIDYGYPGSEFFREDRLDGTLRCYFKHTVLNDPFRLLGLQDITTSVNFSTVANIAAGIGFDILGFTTQERFLVNNKIEEIFVRSNSDDTVENYLLAQEAKRLLLPTEMGQYIKVMALGKNFSGHLRGFVNDESGRL